MAVTPTGAIFNYLTYGGINSADYGIYITGAGVYNAPARAVELTAVPGRNGAIPIDMGYWENVEVVYPAGCFADNADDFAQNIADFRNAILSQRGYQRLEDTYNPNEYRMALCVSEFEVDPVAMNSAGEFEIKFNCKPQRFLKSGETATAVLSGGSLSNPTEMDALPLLAIKGYGNINIGSYKVTVSDAVLGNIQLLAPIEGNAVHKLEQTFGSSLVASGNTITVNGIRASIPFDASKVINPSATTTSTSGITPTSTDVIYRNDGYNSPSLEIIIDAVTFTAGTTSTKTCTLTANFTTTDNLTTNATLTVSIGYAHPYLDVTIFKTVGSYLSTAGDIGYIYRGAVTAYSTASALGNPTYFDCETGIAYRIDNLVPYLIGKVVSTNGADLPVLIPGTNSITYDNTVTELKITPRWWQL